MVGEALAAAERLLAEGGEGSLDLCFLDPPYGSEATYARKRSIQLPDGPCDFEVPAFEDARRDDLARWLDNLYPVLVRCRTLLAPHGALYLHLDHRRGPYARLLLDEVFGANCLVNEIIWAYGLGGSSPRRLQRKHDVIWFYARDPDRLFFEPPQEAATSTLLAGQPKTATDVWESADSDDLTAIMQDWPDDIVRKTLSNRDPERTGYPTQKPLSIALRIVRASLPEGGTLFDPMCGSGTMGLAASLLGRQAVLADRGVAAADVARGRLQAAGAEITLSAVDGGGVAWGVLTGEEPICALEETAHGLQARLLPRALPWDREAVLGPAAARLEAAAAADGTSLLSAWGIGEVLDDGARRALAWWDGGARRVRPAVEGVLALPPSVGGQDLEWLGVDLAGRLWRRPLTSPARTRRPSGTVPAQGSLPI
jgi:DNA modification methylase